MDAAALRAMQAPYKEKYKDAPDSAVARTVYRIHLKPGIRYAPHPAFARDAQGRPRYLALSAADMRGRHRLSDFPEVGTRELEASDFINQIKRLAHPRIHSPILGHMAEIIFGLKELAAQLATAKLNVEVARVNGAKNSEIDQLKAKLDAVELTRKLAVTEAVGVAERERDALKNALEKVQLEKQLAETSLRDKYETQLKDREATIDRLRDLKARLSTKMLGETLEQHCETEFNRIRSTAFARAYFEKDNDARAGSKGDYIFRDLDESGIEVVSIMFEMKNEADKTATKSKNEDFLKELDKDRNEKNCEYAVLVSLLEPDSELYNTGIVDVSHRFPKMYVVRPQFFLPIIALLRNAALNTVKYKSELAQVKAQNIDITHFEDKLRDFKTGFARNYEIAAKRFELAIEEIDKSINHLQKTKEALLTTNRQLGLANDKAQEVTIKRLTHNNPTMKAKFAALEHAGDDDSE